MRKGEEEQERGLLFSSGLIVGEGIIGILSAVFGVISIGESTMADKLTYLNNSVLEC